MTEILQGRQALVIEDEGSVAMMIEAMLMEKGCAVEVTGRLTDALAIAKTGQFDFAVLDINLNGLHSYPVADILSGRGVPIVFSSGYGGSVLPEMYRQAPTLQKPFREQELMTAVMQALGQEHR